MLEVIEEVVVTVLLVAITAVLALVAWVSLPIIWLPVAILVWAIFRFWWPWPY